VVPEILHNRRVRSGAGVAWRAAQGYGRGSVEVASAGDGSRMGERTGVEILTAPRVLLGHDLVGPGWVAIDAGRIADVGVGTPPQRPTHRLPAGVLAPGLVDAQVNGGFGVDVAAAHAQSWRRLLTSLPSAGVTAFVPTVITAPIAELGATLRRLRRLLADADAEGGELSGAAPLGVHVEGPFLAMGRRGAHPPEHLRDPTPPLVQDLLVDNAEVLAYVTLAPERAGALGAIDQLVAAGVRVAVGHSDATAEQVARAADHGATLVTHLFNAQRPLRHRDPGVVGAALADPRLTSGLIVDGHHVHDVAVRVAFAAAPGRIMLVTDAIAALGMPPGRYELGGRTTIVTADAPPALEDGTLAGSALRLDAAVGRAVAAGIEPAAALQAATRVPADALGHHDRGRLAPGAIADLVWLDDAWRAGATWCAGVLAYRRDDHDLPAAPPTDLRGAP
jgi:N-acetylglucosamine-6-phosphate deacetylase